MPKVGAEPVRRAALVEATIAELGGAGTLDITVGQIARRAGMSSALAHHYFGGKDDIFAAAMRQILKDLQATIRVRLAQAHSPVEKVRAIIEGSFAPAAFDPVNITAWTLFYTFSQTSPKAERLLRIYQSRLRTHLVVNLRALTARPEQDAETLAALIDGIYLRAALGRDKSGREAAAHVLAVFDHMVEGVR